MKALKIGWGFEKLKAKNLKENEKENPGGMVSLEERVRNDLMIEQ